MFSHLLLGYKRTKSLTTKKISQCNRRDCSYCCVEV